MNKIQKFVVLVWLMISLCSGVLAVWLFSNSSPSVDPFYPYEVLVVGWGFATVFLFGLMWVFADREKVRKSEAGSY